MAKFILTPNDWCDWEDKAYEAASRLADENDNIILPAKNEVCGRCNGEGVHDHPAFANGLTWEDFAEDPDFYEEYRSGMYDVVCTECKGLRVVPVVYELQLSEDQKIVWNEYQEDLRCIAEMNREMEAERRMGA